MIALAIAMILAGLAIISAVAAFCWSTWIKVYGAKIGTREFFNAIFYGM